MTSYQSRMLKRLLLQRAQGLRRVGDLPGVLAAGPLHDEASALLAQARSRALLDAVPPYFSQTVISPDRRTATLSFGLKLMPLERQFEVLRRMQRELRPAARRDGAARRTAGARRARPTTASPRRGGAS